MTKPSKCTLNISHVSCMSSYRQRRGEGSHYKPINLSLAVCVFWDSFNYHLWVMASTHLLIIFHRWMIKECLAQLHQWQSRVRNVGPASPRSRPMDQNCLQGNGHGPDYRLNRRHLPLGLIWSLPQGGLGLQKDQSSCKYHSKPAIAKAQWPFTGDFLFIGLPLLKVTPTLLCGASSNPVMHHNCRWYDDHMHFRSWTLRSTLHT